MEVSDAMILKAVKSFAPLRSRGTLVNLLAFGRILKQLGMRVSLSQVVDASRSLEFVNLESRSDFQAALRSNLVFGKEDLPLFDRVFDCFWRRQLQPDSPESLAGEEEGQAVPGSELEEMSGNVEEIFAEDQAQEEEDGRFDSSPFPTYSALETLARKDFSEMGIEESRAMARALLLIASKIATQVSRRKKSGAKGTEMDPRHTLRRNLKYGGEIVELVRRKRRIKKTRVILLCDVSGSMDCYSRFLIQFMYGLQNELWGVETFVFSTALSRITHLIRTKDIVNALERISTSVAGWSGGTNIGRSLATFNRDFAPAMVTHRTVVVIISDGWDRGEVGLLEKEMKDLKRRCYKVIWLNPLLASDHYQPLCKGMKAALPHLDFFLSVNNLESLVSLGRTLYKLVA
jgi:uncharacterized protein with von Willebrand factor type A (vWA) domain